MILKEWLEKAKSNKCDYIKVYFTKYEGTYEKDQNGKPHITKKWMNKPIDYKNNLQYLQCDVVKEEIDVSEATDPIYGGKEKIKIGCCWLDNDHVKLVMKGKYKTMNVAELLKQEKGKYTSYEPHYKELKNTPFAYINGRKLEDMKVLSYFYKESESLSFGLDLKFKGKNKDKVLIIIWEK